MSTGQTARVCGVSTRAVVRRAVGLRIEHCAFGCRAIERRVNAFGASLWPRLGDAGAITPAVEISRRLVTAFAAPNQAKRDDAAPDPASFHHASS
jgi:hypothetical protein